jgi:hypothetical protein
MRYRLRTLLILLAILPPLLWFGWTKYEAWRVEQERQRAIRATSQLPIDGTTSDLVNAKVDVVPVPPPPLSGFGGNGPEPGRKR